MDKEVKSHPDFIAAMKKRGITDFTFLRCLALPPGYFGTDEQRGRRNRPRPVLGHAGRSRHPSETESPASRLSLT